MNVAFSKLGVLSPDGICRSFDEKANGYVRSEGCGCIVIKELEKALKDNDHIYCVISGVYSNHGGLTPSLTMPSKEMQMNLIKNLIELYGINIDDVKYCELHATGTQVGDPIEVFFFIFFFFFFYFILG
jgi:acyl transferase domain-containing protein